MTTECARIYKILSASAWAQAAAHLPWAEVDLNDGFIHLSSASQLTETARKHFSGRAGLVLLAVAPERLEEGTLRWEVSRGGARFPHVYGQIPRDAVVDVVELPVIDDRFVFAEDEER